MPKPTIALTFDDGPCEKTLHLLDTLAQHNAHASFFIVGQEAQNGRHITLRAHQAGHQILNHTWSHPDLTTLTADEIKKELLDTEAVITAIVGHCPKIFRPPYGRVNDTVKAVAAELGYAILNWSVDPMDWDGKASEQIYSEIMAKVHDHAVILCHDIFEATPPAIEKVVPELMESYRMVTVSELFEGVSLTPGQLYTHRE